MTWVVSHCVHVWPEGDVLQHELSPDCPCGPAEERQVREDGHAAFLFTHASLDGRELSEG